MLSKSVTGFAGLFYAEQYRVAIAVKTHADQALGMARTSRLFSNNFVGF